MNTIFIIEDDYDYGNALSDFLNHQGFSCIVETDLNNIKQITEVMETKRPALVIMDYYFNDGQNSINLMTYLKQYATPIVYLTSNQNINDELDLYKLGINDFINKEKPFAIINEKLKLMLSQKLEYTFFNNTLNVETKKINNTIKLTDNEYRILLFLIKKTPEYASTEEIMLELWNESIFIEKNTLFVAIKRLREKLKHNNLNVEIVSFKNKGYIINEL